MYDKAKDPDALMPRGDCAICKKPTLVNELTMHVFRASATRYVEWVHIACVRKAVETWILRKEEKEKK